MRNSPQVSVVMSVYNGEDYLSESIDSILRQTFEDFEFIIVDDASSDSTSRILAGYHDARLHILTNDRSEEHTSELQSLMRISYAVFCLKKKKNLRTTRIITT